MEYKNTYNNLNDTEVWRYGDTEERLFSKSSLNEIPQQLQTCIDLTHPTYSNDNRSADTALSQPYRSIALSPNKSPVAFFDSGVGGLTVFNKFKKLLPNENCLYFGDTKNMPYGEKTEEQLLEYADNIFKFFETKGAKAVIMACNTTSAVTYEKLKNNYSFKIYPIIQSVCKELANLPDVKKLGIIATPATVKSRAYSKEISKYNSKVEVSELSAPNWVRIVEEHRIYQPQSIEQVKEILDIMSDFAPDKIVLACTHYPYLIDVLKKFMPEDMFIDPAENFARIIKDDLTENNMLNDKFEYEKFFVSDNPENFKEAAKMFYEQGCLPEVINFG
ncbi:glutamate racemase [bacterium]|nr:glutamate racemase [bacterium]